MGSKFHNTSGFVHYHTCKGFLLNQAALFQLTFLYHTPAAFLRTRAITASSLPFFTITRYSPRRIETSRCLLLTNVVRWNATEMCTWHRHIRPEVSSGPLRLGSHHHLRVHHQMRRLSLPQGGRGRLMMRCSHLLLSAGAARPAGDRLLAGRGGRCVRVGELRERNLVKHRRRLVGHVLQGRRVHLLLLLVGDADPGAARGVHLHRRRGRLWGAGRCRQGHGRPRLRVLAVLVHGRRRRCSARLLRGSDLDPGGMRVVHRAGHAAAGDHVVSGCAERRGRMRSLLMLRRHWSHRNYNAKANSIKTQY